MSGQHLDKFYEVIALPSQMFSQRVEQEFIGAMSKWQMMGGASTSSRKKAVQEAVDALEIYRQMGFPDAAQKTRAFKEAHDRRFKPVDYPNPSPNVSAIQNEMKKIEATYNIMMAKFCLLDYWEGVATGKTEPEYPADGAHWALHEFLNFEPMKVRPILELMLEDAQNVLSKPYSASFETWRGVSAERHLTYEKSSMARVINADASMKAGAEIKGQVEMEYKGFKMKADAEAFAGARAGASGSASVSRQGLEAKGSVEVEVGIRVKANVSVDVFDVLDLSATADAIAGALANAKAEITVTATGMKLKASAEAFAGAQIKGEATGRLKIGGREVFKGTAKGAASAGIGAEAAASFECSLFGKVAMGADAGTTFGLGASAGTEVTVDFHNATWGAINLFYAYLNEHGFRNKGKVWLLPLEENTKMCVLARDKMFEMMGRMYQGNEAQLAKLEAWKVLENKVAVAARRNPAVQIRTKQMTA